MNDALLESLFVPIVSGRIGESTEVCQLPGEIVPEEFPRWAEKRQREFSLGRKFALEALTKAGAESCSVERRDSGAPIFPPGFRGSISHTGRSVCLAAAIVGKADHSYGLDVEELREISPEMVKRIMVPGELEDNSLPQAPLIHFSVKEAYYKATHPLCGLSLGFQDLRLSQAEVHDADGGILLRLGITPSAELTSQLPRKATATAWLGESHVLSAVSFPIED